MTHPGRYFHALSDGGVRCDLCPRLCALHPGERGSCFVRACENDAIVLTTYGRSSGFCVDPLEKKPLNHFLPGTSVLSFGTAGCNHGSPVIGRDGYDLTRSDLRHGACGRCGVPIPGVFEGRPGDFGARRFPLRIGG